MKKVAALWMTIILFLSFIIIIVEIPPQVGAVTIYVDDDGGADYSKIQDAINVSSDGDIIIVYSGKYIENLIINKSISLEGENKDTTIISGNWKGNVVSIKVDWVNISKFTISKSSNGTGAGIELHQVKNCRIDNNFFLDCKNGIYIGFECQVIITNNTMDNGGISVRGIPSNTHYIDSSNTVNGRSVYYMKDQNGGTVPLGVGQVILANCQNIEIKNQNIMDVGMGIQLLESSNNNVTNNTISSCHTGVYIYHSNANHIIGNRIISNEYWGLHLDSSGQNNISDNIISNNKYAIAIISTQGNTLQGNIMIDNNILLPTWGELVEYWNAHTIDSFNTVNGKPVHYLKNQVGGTAPLNAGQLILANCTHVNIKNQEIIDGSNIQLGYSSFNNITDNLVCNSNWSGIYLYKSNNNYISRNNFSNNSGDGISLHRSENNTVKNNIVNSNIVYGVGLGFNSHNNSVVNNTLINNRIGINLGLANDNNLSNNMISSTQNGININKGDRTKIISNNIFGCLNDGIHLTHSNENQIVGNILTNNDGGTYIHDANDNSIHHNNFIDNRIQIHLETTNSFNNTWDDGIGEGNYWSDYRGLDDGSNGRPANDDVGDTDIPHPHSNGGGGYYHLDYYPLIEPSPDNQAPRIQLLSPDNNSLIRPGVILDLEIFEGNLATVIYSIDDGTFNELTTPYDINTSEWPDGQHIITIYANDTSGNVADLLIEITIEATYPYVVSSIPINNSNNVKINTTIIIFFNELMNQSNVGNYVSITPEAYLDISWEVSGTMLFIFFETKTLSVATTYVLTITSNITDLIGNPMTSDFILIFTTAHLDSDGDDIPDIEDTDDDNDGYPDDEDAFPLNATEWRDTDGDGIGDNADPDDDDDGHYDEDDVYPRDPSRWKKTDDSGFPNMILLMLLIIVIIIIVLSLLIIKKKGRKAGEDMEPK